MVWRQVPALAIRGDRRIFGQRTFLQQSSVYRSNGNAARGLNQRKAYLDNDNKMKDQYLAYTHENYLSLSDIMVTEEKITCTLQSDYHGLGYIHPSCGSLTGDLLKGTPANPTILDLPLWMVQELCHPQRQRRQVDVHLPKAFHEEARRILSADPGVVDLRRESSGRGGWRFSENYYALGLYVLRLISQGNDKDRKDIQKSLTHTFTLRFRKIFDWSNSTHRDILTHYTNRLDRSEVQLLKIGKDEQAAFTKWVERKSKTLKASNLVKDKASRPSSILADLSLAKRARV